MTFSIAEFRGLGAVIADLDDRSVVAREDGFEYVKERLCESVGDREELIVRTS